MASDTPPSGAAFRAGIVILVAALVISFVAAEKIESYYFEEKVIEDDEEQTWKEYCDEAPSNWETTLQICEEKRHDIYSAVWGVILSFGLALMCFAQSGNYHRQELGKK